MQKRTVRSVIEIVSQTYYYYYYTTTTREGNIYIYIPVGALGYKKCYDKSSAF